MEQANSLSDSRLVRPAPRRRDEGLLRLIAVLLVAYVVTLWLGSEGILQSSVATTLGLVTEAAAVLLCWRAVGFVGYRRLEVTLGACAVTSYWIGDGIYTYSSLDGAPLVTASVADVAYVAFAVLILGSLGLVVYRQMRGLVWPILLDSLVGTLAAASVTSIVLAPALSAAAVWPVSLESVIAVAYPLLDLAIIALIAGILASRGLDLGRRWPVLLGGLALFIAFDVVYALDPGAYAIGSISDAAWTAGVIAVALWVDGVAQPSVSRHRGAAGIPALAAPIVSTVAALGVLILASQTAVPVLAVVLACSTLAAAAIPLSFRHRLQQALVRTDDLTGLTNRRALYSDVPLRLQPGRRGALLLLDLDRFKDVNDGLGHDIGDGLLQRVSQRLVDQIRTADLISRIGGDEFAIFLDDASEEGAVEVAARISDSLATPFLIGAISVQTSASIGIAMFPAHGTDLDSLLRSADVAMYRAKGDHNSHQLYHLDYNDHREFRFRTVQELRTALTEDQLIMHYQPKVRPGCAEIIDAESLVRWNHPTRGLLYPESFLQLAEDAGIMPQLTRVILRQVLDQMVSWRSEGFDLRIAVNVSASCLRPDLPHQITQMLSERNLPPMVLLLEITEEVLMLDSLRAVGVLRELQARGIEISIDDFGTGYSSLAYLRDLPVNELKLDRSFISPIHQDRRAASLVASIIDLAHSLGLRIVAEGVEDEAAFTELGRLGCDLIQGYYLSRPMPAEALNAWLSSRRLAVDPV